MLEALRAHSSGATKAFEKALLRCDDPGDGFGLGSCVPLVELKGPAKEDAVGAREHVTRAAGDRVAHLRLRLEDGELATRGMEVLIIEQLPAAEPGAVENQVLR